MADFSTDVKAILKEWVSEGQVWNLLFRGSPTLALFEKFRAGGKYYRVPMMTSRGGCVLGDYSLLATYISKRPKNADCQVGYGNCFTGNYVDSKEYNASEMGAGAFVQLIKEFFFATCEALRQTESAAIFGSGLGDIGIVKSVDTSSQLYFTCAQWGAMAIDIGSQLVFATGPYATGALRSASPVEVSAVEGVQGTNDVKVTVSSGFAATVAAGDWVCLYGFRASTATPLNFQGLRAWLPTIGDRTGSTWTTYIGTTFNNVDRSVYVDRLAGNYILRDDAANEKYSDAVVRGIRACRRMGGTPDAIVLNDVDFATIISEIDAYKQYFQKINGPDSAGKVEITKGLSAMMFAMSTSWVQYVIDDPYCPQGIGYVLEKGTWGLAMLSNPSPLKENIPSTNEAGTLEAASAGGAPGNYQWNVDDYIDTTPTDVANGPGLRIAIKAYAALFCRQPGHNAVIKFDVSMP